MLSLLTQPVLILGIAPTQVQDLALEGSQEHIPAACPCPSHPSLPNQHCSAGDICELAEAVLNPIDPGIDSIYLSMGPWMPQILSQNLICIFKKLDIPQSQWTYTFEVLLTLMFAGFAD